jgi:probable HAF family extracellular repeat protein
MSGNRIPWMVTCLAAMAIHVAVWADVQYAITDLGSLGGGRSEAMAINNLGEIVGTSSNAAGTFDAFSYANGS